MTMMENILSLAHQVEDRLIKFLDGLPAGVRVRRVYVTPDEAYALSRHYDEKVNFLPRPMMRRERIREVDEMGYFRGVKLAVREKLS